MDGGFGGSIITGSSISEGSGHDHKSARIVSKRKTGANRKAASKKKAPVVDEAVVSAIVGIQLTVKHAFGSTALPLDGVQSFYSSVGDKDANDRIVFRVGKQLCVYNGEGSEQRFFTDRGRNVTNVNHFSLSANGRYVSVCEAMRKEPDPNDDELELPGTHSAQISVYSLTTYARLKTMSHTCSSDFVCSTFCGDTKFLASITGGPDCLIIVWLWEKEKLYKSCSLPCVATKICSSPSSHMMLTTSGPGIMKCWFPGSDGVLKSASLLVSAKENDNFLDHSWLPFVGGGSTHKMICLTNFASTHRDGDNPGGYNNNHKRTQIVYVFEGTEGTTSVGTVPIMLDNRQTLILKIDTDIGCRINALIPSAKGFCCVGARGYLSFYDRTEDLSDPYVESRLLLVDADEDIISGSVVPSEDKVVLLCKSSKVLSVSLAFDADAAMNSGGTSSTEIASIGDGGGSSAFSEDDYDTFSDDDETRKPKQIVGASALLAKAQADEGKKGSLVSDFTPGGFHISPIIAADCASQRSILCTLSSSQNSTTDRVLRIWDFEMQKCELAHKFNMEPLAMAVHYSGYQLLVSFKDRVRMYFILMDKLKQCKETVLKACKNLKFCNNGQYWAGASSINVVIYETQSFTQLMTFQGHMLSVQCMSWEKGDQVLFSAGMDGNVYGWQSNCDQRVDIVPSSSHSPQVLSMTVDSTSPLFAVASDHGDDAPDSKKHENVSRVLTSMVDGDIRVSQYAYTQVSGGGGSHRNEVQTLDSYLIPGDGPKYQITVLKMSSNRRHLYAGMSNGRIRIYAWPEAGKIGSEAVQPVYIEYPAHTSPVVDIRENINRSLLMTCAEDGTIFIYGITAVEATTASDNTAAAPSVAKDIFSDLDEIDHYHSGTVLMSTDDIEEHIVQICDLQKKLQDTTSKYNFEMHQRETFHSEEVRTLQESMASQLKAETVRYEDMHVSFTKRTKELTTNISQLQTEQIKAVAEIENRYEHKLAMQLDRYDKVCEEMETLAQQCDGLLISERADFNHQINELKNEARLHEKKMKAETRRVREDRVADEGAFKEILDQQEDEYECELRELISAAESEIGTERENISKLRTLVQTKNTKLDQMKKKLQELSIASKARLVLLQTERKEKAKLLDAIEHYKRNLTEREEALLEKEKVILELRNTTRTLENFRFVLNHRLQQLSSERGPITTHIEGLEHHISTMYEELVEEFDSKKQESMHAAHKDTKIQMLSRDLVQIRADVKRKEILIAAFRREVSIINDSSLKGKDLEDMVAALYRKYVESPTDHKPSLDGKVVKSSSLAVKKAKELINSGPGEDDCDSDSGSDNDGARRRKNKSGGGHSKGLAKEVEVELIESAKEAERQKLFVERKSHDLKHRLERTRSEAVRVTKTRLNENSSLMYECNDLRREVRELNRKLDVTQAKLANTERSLRTARASGVADNDAAIQMANAIFPPYFAPSGSSSNDEHMEKPLSVSASVDSIGQSSVRSDKVEPKDSMEMAVDDVVIKYNVNGSNYDSNSVKNMPPIRYPSASTSRITKPGSAGTSNARSMSANALHASGNKVPYKAAVTVPSGQRNDKSDIDSLHGQPLKGPNGINRILSTRHHPGGSSSAMGKREHSLSASHNDRTVEKLNTEVEALVGQLDQSHREKQMQSREIVRLLSMLHKAGIPSGANTNISPLVNFPENSSTKYGQRYHGQVEDDDMLLTMNNSYEDYDCPSTQGTSSNVLGQRLAVRDGSQAIVMNDMKPSGGRVAVTRAAVKNAADGTNARLVTRVPHPTTTPSSPPKTLRQPEVSGSD